MANELSTEFELADATHVRVLETNLLHASDVIYWLDGTSAAEQDSMSRIQTPLDITFTSKPTSVKYLHSLGKTALWQTPTEPMHLGSTTDVDRTRPTQAPFNVVGNISDPSRRYNPAAFDLTLGAADGQAVVLYPSPFGVASTAAGLLCGQVIWNATGEPLIWGILTLEVSVGMGESVTFRAQTDAHGDFRMALTRLPQLPLSTTNFSANLSIEGDSSANANTPLDFSALTSLELESTTVAASFSEQMALTVKPGVQQRINSANRLVIAVRAVEI